MTIDQMIDEAIGREGGYVNNPKDKGGPTRWGVTEQVARAYGYAGDMKLLPRETAVAIYRQRYAIDPGFDKIAAMSARVGELLFDTGINMGQAIAGQFLQRALNLFNRGASFYPDLKVDGACGAMTRAALESYFQRRGRTGEGLQVLLWTIHGFRTGRYEDISIARPANEEFAYGWIARQVRMGIAA
ncbi:glycoside hydrolase family 108 protein [Sphingomonas bisphenolicum]